MLNIDKALLRKGRLSIIYNSNCLLWQDTSKLETILVEYHLSVADIFNFEIK
jgi:hypothetical protein